MSGLGKSCAHVTSYFILLHTRNHGHRGRGGGGGGGRKDDNCDHGLSRSWKIKVTIQENTKKGQSRTYVPIRSRILGPFGIHVRFSMVPKFPVKVMEHLIFFRGRPVLSPGYIPLTSDFLP